MAQTYKLTGIRKFVNRVITWMVKRGSAPARTYLLGVAGRKTGKMHFTPVSLVEHAEEKWLVSPYGESNWVKNARAAGEVSLSLGKSTDWFSIAELQAEDAAPILKEYLKNETITRPFFDVTPQSSLATFETEAHLHPVFKLEKK